MASVFFDGNELMRKLYPNYRGDLSVKNMVYEGGKLTIYFRADDLPDDDYFMVPVKAVTVNREETVFVIDEGRQ